MAGWLNREQDVVTSELTFLEARRAIARQESAGADQERIAALRACVDELEEQWWTVKISTPVCRWAGQPFPLEPVRSLDGIHLATALLVSYDQRGTCVFLSFDRRVRVNAIRMLFSVLPLPADDEERQAWPPRTRLGKAILWRRIQAGVALQDEALGLPRHLLHALEHGTKVPTPEVAQRLATWLGWTVELVMEAAIKRAPDGA